MMMKYYFYHYLIRWRKLSEEESEVLEKIANETGKWIDFLESL